MKGAPHLEEAGEEVGGLLQAVEGVAGQGQVVFQVVQKFAVEGGVAFGPGRLGCFHPLENEGLEGRVVPVIEEVEHHVFIDETHVGIDGGVSAHFAA